MPVQFVTVTESGGNYSGGTQDWDGSFSSTLAGTVTWTFQCVQTGGGTIGPSTVVTTSLSTTHDFYTNCSPGTWTGFITVSDTYGDAGNGNASAVIYVGHLVTQNDTVTITQVGTAAASLFAGQINEIGNVKSTDPMTVYHEGATIAVYGMQTNRSTSTAGSFTFYAPYTIGSAINLGDRVEFGYRGHQAFYGWVYAIDKSNHYVYQITAYDGGYGMAQFAGLGQGDVPRSGATITVSGWLGNFAAQVVGLGAGWTDKLGVNITNAEIPQVLGWGFSQGQILSKLESVAMGLGFVAYTDYLSNLTLSNYMVPAIYPYGSGTVVGTSMVTNILLQENADGFVVQSKQFDPSEKYGFWQVNGLEASGATLSATVGATAPQRTMGTGWLFVATQDATILSAIANEYYNVFSEGVWTVTAWSKRWFDPGGVDTGGSLEAYIGDDKYLIAVGPLFGIGITNVSFLANMYTLETFGCSGGVYVPNSENPVIYAAQVPAITAWSKFLTTEVIVPVGTIGVSGTLTGQSIAYDGLDTLYTAVPGATSVVYATNWYSGVSSAIATIASSVTTILAPLPGVVLAGTPNGVVLVSSGLVIDGTSGYAVTRMFYDSTSNYVYVCAGTTTVPYFQAGKTSTVGTFNVGAAAVPEGVRMGCALQDGGGGVVFGGTVSIAYGVGGIIASTVAVGSGTVLADMVYDTAYLHLIVAAAVSGAHTTNFISLNPTSLGSAPQQTYAAGPNADPNVRIINPVISRQNLYTIQFADGTTLYNCIITNSQVTQSGTTITFESGQTSPGAFAGPTDTTQLSVWNVVQTLS